jgi:hypothetical protein
MFSLARLPVSMTRQEAERRMTEAVRAQVPIADTAWHMSLTPAQEEYTLGVRPAIRLLAGAALFLLLLAQASVGGLLLARATSQGARARVATVTRSHPRPDSSGSSRSKRSRCRLLLSRSG